MLKRETEERASLSSRGRRVYSTGIVRKAKKECQKIRKYDKEKMNAKENK
jgi:hypothetical protein